MTTATLNQMKALIQLLCTEESQTNTHLVRERLVELGLTCVPILEEALAARVDLAERERIESVLREIRWLDLEEQFRSWAEQGRDLEEGVFLLARFGYPTLDAAKYRGMLDQMATDVWPRIKSPKKSADVVRILNHHFFDDLGFHGNTVNYYDPDNSYLNRVMDQRTGIPISLSIVILLVAKRLGLSLVGVGLPGHFLVRYEEGSQKTDQQTYIDTFNRGQVLTKEECTKFIKDAGYGYREEFFRTSTSTEILVRMMRNLIFVYNQLQETQKVEWLSRYVMAVT